MGEHTEHTEIGRLRKKDGSVFNYHIVWREETTRKGEVWRDEQQQQHLNVDAKLAETEKSPEFSGFLASSESINESLRYFRVRRNTATVGETAASEVDDNANS